MIENIVNLVKETNLRVQEAQRVSDTMKLKRSTPRHIIIKIPKVRDKDRILKTARKWYLLT